MLDPWRWFMAWYDIVPLSSMITILEKCFSPKWLQVLHIWLNNNPNNQEIQQWYSEALMMIDRRISGTFNVQQISPSEPYVNINYEAVNNHGVAVSSSRIISSFQDLVEKEAIKHDIVFLPIPN
ncbi:unnamed protein product [Rotaria sp. Silwood2]|nr:unnamed protein product [Rotaria sp. Silwood2]